MSTEMNAVYATLERLATKAMSEYRELPAGRATMYYRATTFDADGDVIVRHPDMDVEPGYEVALVLSAAWPYDLTKRNMVTAMRRLPILPLFL